MKKVLTYLLGLCLLIVMAGCEASAAVYDTYITATVNDEVSIGIQAEKDWWNYSYFHDDDAEDSKTIIFEGNEYTGTYVHSVLGYCDWSITDIYETEDWVEFYIYRDTDELCSINIKPKKNYWDELSTVDIDYSAEEVEELVKRYASEYIDVEKYVMEMIRSYTTHEDDVIVYYYTFTKFIGELETADKLWVEYSSKGTAVCVSWCAIGAFDDITIPEGAVEKTDLSVADKVQKVYATSYSTESAEVSNQILTYSPEGNLVIISDVKVKLKSKDGEEMFDTTIELTTIID